MLIRSQDKESIVNLGNVESIDIIGFQDTKDGYIQDYDNANVWKFTYSGYEKMSYIGEYTNKNKAIKVLDMIQENYKNLEALHCGFGIGDGCEVCEVFQMPQDCEVSEE